MDTPDEMANAVAHVYQIDRRYCREYVKENFDVPRMADDYFKAYEQILSQSHHRKTTEIVTTSYRPLEHNTAHSM